MTRETIREQFGTHASDYINSKTHAQGASLTCLVELIRPQPEWQVRDIATGAGHTAMAFAPYVAHVTATGNTPQMLDQARRLASEQGLSNITVETAVARAVTNGLRPLRLRLEHSSPGNLAQNRRLQLLGQAARPDHAILSTGHAQRGHWRNGKIPAAPD